jgi:transposase
LIVDALGNPLAFVLSGGERNDITQAPVLLAGRQSDYVIADKAYDASTFIEQIEAQGALPVIPPRKSWRTLRYYDPHLYRERHIAECCVNKLKHFRHIFSRFDKLASRYLSFLQFVATLIWLR